jgi:hypothetical protein
VDVNVVDGVVVVVNSFYIVRFAIQFISWYCKCDVVVIVYVVVVVVEDVASHCLYLNIFRIHGFAYNTCIDGS